MPDQIILIDRDPNAPSPMGPHTAYVSDVVDAGGNVAGAPFGIAFDTYYGQEATPPTLSIEDPGTALLIPANTAAPELSNTNPTEGAPVATSNGIWDNGPTSFQYRWWLDGVLQATATEDTFATAFGSAGGTLYAEVRAGNAAGFSAWVPSASATIAALVQDNQVLDFSAADTGLTVDFPNSAEGILMDGQTVPLGEIDEEGVFYQCIIYHDGVDFGNMRVMGHANPLQADEYIQIHTSRVILRMGGTDQSPPDLPFLAAAPGWYVITARVWRDGNDIHSQLFRNELVSEVLTFGSASFDMRNFTRFGWSMTPDSTESFGRHRMTSLTVGRGNPIGLHEAVYNNGQFTDPRTYNVQTDDRVTLVLSETGTRQGVAEDAVDLADLSAVDGQGLTRFTEYGDLRWAAIEPSYLVGEFGTVSDITAETSGGGSTFSVTTTLPSANWDTPSIDMSKVHVRVRRGFGSVAITGQSIALNGSEATVTFTLSRQVYESEVLICNLELAWIADAAKNRSGLVTEFEILNTSALAVPSVVMGLSNADISFDFAQPYTAGITQDGIMWVLDPGGGVVIVGKSPAQSTVVQGTTDRLIHGTMRNPQRREDNLQGYGNVGSRAPSRFDAALAISFPQTLAVNESLIGARSNPQPYYELGGVRTPPKPLDIISYQGLIVTDFVPGPDDFAPPLLGYDATDRPAWITVDVAAIVTSLPAGYDTVGLEKPDFEILLKRIERFHPALYQFSEVMLKREMTPIGFTKGDGYGVNFISTTGCIGLMLISSESTTAQRERAVRWIIHHYRQWYGIGKNSSDGGHNQGDKVVLVAGDHWANGGAGIPTMLDDTGGNEQTAFQIEDQALLDILTQPHDRDPDRPQFLERTQVQSINGNTVTFERFGRIEEDSSSMRNAVRQVQNLILVGPGDVDIGTVTGGNEDTGSITFNTVSGLSIGDIVYFRAPWQQQVGDVEWTIRKNRWDLYSPSRETDYRGLNEWSAQVLFLQALGLIHPTFHPMRGYVEMANASATPVAGNDFPDHFNVFVYGDLEPASGSIQFDRSFWQRHWETIRLVPQLY